MAVETKMSIQGISQLKFQAEAKQQISTQSFAASLSKEIQAFSRPEASKDLENEGMFRILCHGFGSRICLSASGSKSQVREWAFNQPRRRS
ncbi:MAG: hypothetical protein HUK40_14555 [Desulfobacter sp.]|nr:hypothetical protein [Desulfobacter sp.]MDD9303484.1 hypothetical protein [Desulfobacter sp.]